MEFGGGHGVIRKDKENARQNVQERGLRAVDVCRTSDGRPSCTQRATVWLLFLGAPEDEVSELPLMSSCVKTQAKAFLYCLVSCK